MKITLFTVLIREVLRIVGDAVPRVFRWRGIRKKTSNLRDRVLSADTKDEKDKIARDIANHINRD